MHKRKEIRTAVKSMLDGKILHKNIAVPVVKNKVTPALIKEVPLIAVYTFKEPANDMETAPRRYYRTPLLSIQVIVEAEDGRVLDDDLDDIATQIEEILFKDPLFGEVVDDSKLNETSLAMKDEGNRILGSIVLDFTVEYQDDSVVIPEDDPLDGLESSLTEIRINESENADISASQEYEQPPPPEEPEPEPPN